MSFLNNYTVSGVLPSAYNISKSRTWYEPTELLPRRDDDPDNATQYSVDVLVKIMTDSNGIVQIQGYYDYTEETWLLYDITGDVYDVVYDIKVIMWTYLESYKPRIDGE